MKNLKVPYKGMLYEFTGNKIFYSNIIRVVPSIHDHLVIVTPTSDVQKVIYGSDENSSMHSYDSLIAKGLLTPIPMPESKNPVDPTHYNTKGIQPIDYIMANGLGFNEGNVVKYVTRWKD